MVSNRCKIVVKEILRELDLHFILVELGEVEIMENISFEQREILNYKLLECGLEIMCKMNAFQRQNFIDDYFSNPLYK
jgi:hypothetical protein